MVAIGGGGLDDEGMSSALALFLEAIYKKRMLTFTKIKSTER